MGATAKAPSFSMSGENCSSAKLTWEQVDEIRALLKKSVSQSAIARQFGVSQTLISHIGLGQIWKPETRNAITKLKFASDFVRLHNSRSSNAVARVLHKKWPDLFSTFNHAFVKVCVVRGCAGEHNRRVTRDKSLYREPARLIDG